MKLHSLALIILIPMLFSCSKSDFPKECVEVQNKIASFAGSNNKVTDAQIKVMNEEWQKLSSAKKELAAEQCKQQLEQIGNKF